MTSSRRGQATSSYGARLRTLLWRCACERAPRQLCVGPLPVDLDVLQASWAGQALALAATDFDLLAFLASAPERAWTRPELLGRGVGRQVDE